MSSAPSSASGLLSSGITSPEPRQGDDFARIVLEEAVAFLEGRAVGPEPLVEYQTDPVGFCVEVLGIAEHTIRWSLNPGYEGHEWDGTPDPLIEGLEALARWENVGAESGTGTGKTFTLGAAVMLWFLGSFPNAIVITVAPKKDQLQLNLWKEASRLWPRFAARFPAADMTTLKIRMKGGIDESWAATGFVAGVGADEDSAAKARGFHAEYMLWIFEEMPGIHGAITTAAENTCTGPHNLRLGLGNPDSQMDELHRHCEQEDVRAIRISALDHPNLVCNDASIVPGACSWTSVKRREKKFGKGSRMYNAMVRGISPAEAADALIRKVWIDRAVARWENPDRRAELERIGGPALGVDVANSEAGDEAAIARGRGAVLQGVSAFPCPNSNVLGLQVHLEAKDGEEIPDQHIGVDPSGVGAGTVNELKRLGRWVPLLHASSKPVQRIDRDVAAEDEVGVRETELYLNLRAQMWWQLREDLQKGRIALPPDEELIRELVVPTWEAKLGRIKVEPKEDIVKRLGRSPNRADAVCLWNWCRPRPQRAPVDDDVRPFDPAVIRAEYEHLHRVRHPRPRKSDFDPMQVTM